MSKIAVVYWSGTGNTEQMASAILEGAKEKGADAVLFETSAFDASTMDDYDAVAFGCPAMGDEVLEEDEFQPMFDSCEAKLSGKKIALFGSYGWGDGEWMRSWEETCKNAGAILACSSVICNDAPDDAATEQCKALGAALAQLSSGPCQDDTVFVDYILDCNKDYSWFIHKKTITDIKNATS